MSRSSRRTAWWLVRLAALLSVLGLLFVIVRDARPEEILSALGRLQLWQLGVIFSIDVIIHALMACRWWLILRTEDRRIPYLPLVAIRLAAFGISYFTLGPQVGGEPLQVLYLRENRKTTLARAVASVLMDKLLELLANFFLLVLALAAIPRSEILGGLPAMSSFVLVLLLCLASWPVMHILLLTRRHHPVTTLLALLPRRQRESRLIRHARAAELLAGQFCRRHPWALAGSIMVSLMAAGASVMEYAFITSFVVSGLSFWQNVSAWSAGWLSFLFPTPAGLGALEASQVLALGAFGVPAGTAIAVALVMRARDLVFGGTGLLIAGTTAARVKSKPRSEGVMVEEGPSDGTASGPPTKSVYWD